MTTLFRSSVILCLLLLGSTPAMASIIVQIDGQIQGRIRGDATQQGEEDNIVAMSFSSSIYEDYDPVTGRPSGRARYAPVNLVKEWDRANVPLTQAMHTNERLDVRIRLYTTGGQQLVNYYTIDMEGAFLASLNEMGSATDPPTQNLGFVFNTITWTDELNGISTTDRWEDIAAAVLPPGPSPELALLPPLPNPSSAETMIRFDLPVASHATLDVYDLHGRRVASLFDQNTEHPRTVVRWGGRDFGGDRVANGLYLVKLKWPRGEVTQRVTLIR